VRPPLLPGLAPLAILLAASLLAGCSMVRLAYENADSYLRYRAGTYLDVHGAQAEELDAAIDAFHDWHRKQALPQYARLAGEAAQRVDDGVTPEDLVWGYDSLVAQARIGLREAAQRIAPLLGRLDAQQIAHIESRLAEENRRFAKEFLRGSERARRERRAERIVKRLEDWVGRLSEAQVERVRQYSERVPLMAGMRLRDHQRAQAAGLELLRARKIEALPEFVAYWDRGRDPAYAAAIEDSRRELFAMLLDLDRTLSPEQRARVVANLRRYAAEFQLLSEKR
jgi:hypothetical protein